MRAALALGVGLGVVLAAAPAIAADWEFLFEDEGIKVWRRQVEGSDFVAFRGRGLVKAPILKVAAVIRDADRETEWMENCAAARTVRFLSATDAIVYNRTGSPVPLISDRDTVLKTWTEVVPDKKTVWVRFEQTKDAAAPVVDGVVRMPVLKGHWRMVQKGAYSTELEYQVQADPGGALPAWLVNLVSKKMPFHTVRRLREQVTKSGYESHQNILSVAIDWSAFDAPPTQPTIGPAPGAATSTVAQP